MIKYTKSFLINLYKTMVRIRLCEESLVDPILDGSVKCPVHLYTGQEAVATGVCSALRKYDYIFGTHRSHGHYLAKGGNLRRLLAEIYCKETGCSGGRGGSMHVCDPGKGIIGSVPIVAGTISLALGCALASRIKKEKSITVSFFGDGAVGEGVLHESLNFAALKKLPIIFICENNFYSTHLPISECRPNDSIYKIAMPYGIKSRRIDGNDVLKVYESAKKAIEICTNNDGPVFLEYMTYRFRGHVGPDDNIQGLHSDIRPKEEVKMWKGRDPIKRFELFLEKNDILDRGGSNRIRHRLMSEIKAAHIFAEKSARPTESELNKYVFK